MDDVLVNNSSRQRISHLAVDDSEEPDWMPFLDAYELKFCLESQFSHGCKDLSGLDLENLFKLAVRDSVSNEYDVLRIFLILCSKSFKEVNHYSVQTLLYFFFSCESVLGLRLRHRCREVLRHTWIITCKYSDDRSTLPPLRVSFSRMINIHSNDHSVPRKGSKRSLSNGNVDSSEFGIHFLQNVLNHGLQVDKLSLFISFRQIFQRNTLSQQSKLIPNVLDVVV